MLSSRGRRPARRAGRSLRHVGLWRRLSADLSRPELPTGREERTFLIVAPIVIIVTAQLTDPGTALDVLLLVPAAAAFFARAVSSKFPAEAFALLVIVSVGAAVGRDGDVEGSFFLAALMVLYTSWNLGSVIRSAGITAVSAATPWVVAELLVPGSGIAWTPWTMACVFMFALGRTMHRQRRLIDELERARQALATQAVAEERRRIARELHDLAGHTLAAVLLHVTGARHVLRRNVDEAERALLGAEAVGRASLDQIREVVATLHADERGTDPALAGSEDLPALVEGYRRAGLRVTANLGETAISGPVGTAVHRIVREALTNVARHAPDNGVDIRVAASRRQVQVAVTDHGQPATRSEAQGLSFGLVGMAERARALGGTFEAGPTADGWRVEATLPLADSRSEAMSP